MKHGSLLPNNDVREASLFFVISVLCFLTSLCILAGKSSYSLTANWAQDVQNSLTISLDSHTAPISDIVSQLDATPEISNVRVVDEAEISRILTERLGSDELPAGISIPRLIEVDIAVGANFDKGDVKALIAPMTQNLRIFTHTNWINRIESYLLGVRAVVLLTSSLLIGATILIIGFATHATLYSRRDVISVLHRFGAQDRFIARIFQNRFWSLGIRAGTVGALAALALLSGLMWWLLSDAQAVDSLPQFRLDAVDLLILCGLPFFTGFIAQTTAKHTVLGNLKQHF